ncbi:5' nucleotidase, deoxy (Pyrimidine), cytosolic type C protein (NT5C) [Gimesia panareensis]|uniref:5' nucleotidase, deoxy (Pyrimidine), cytosolic type C protein (NT5C) n=2 Tax=Gimesia panareensis TaxID=2527978 RepID=A0A518FYZ7_9PLAN|nr:5' nucleotidase, deoxy (Pyrimidine), cytosolic type C protein (NT5C) [Gimesia panareensis]
MLNRESYCFMFKVTEWSEKSSMPVRHILLDMDGVISDFMGAILELHGQRELAENWPEGEPNYAGVLGMTKDEFWKPVDSLGGRFWAEFPPYPWLNELLDLIRETAPFTISTSPSRSAACASAKVEWLRQHFEEPLFMDFMIGTQKYLLAKPDVVLIDDQHKNIDKFREHGGQAILFPQPWNANFAITDRIGYVKSELEKLL